MKKTLLPMVGLLVLTTTAWGQNQVATATSAAPFQLRGAAVSPGQGVPSWPVMAGDGLIAGDAPVTISFPDGSSVLLGVMSQARVSLSGQTPVFELQSGTARYSLKSLSSVQIVSAGKPVDVKNRTGDVVTNDGDATTIKAVRSHSLILGKTGLTLLGAGAAAGLGYGLYAGLSGGSPVSPSK